MKKQPNILFSNRVENLYENLKVCLFKTSKPFARRLVVVPSQAMKIWLTLRLANDPEIGISMGIDVILLDKAIQNLASHFSLKPLRPMPSGMGLTFLLESRIKFHIAHTPQNKEWEPITRYLNYPIPKRDRRLAALAERLAENFQKYGIFCKDMNDHGFQTILWKDIFNDQSPWDYPQNQLSNIELIKPRQDWQVHLFALSFIPKIYMDFFEKLAQFVPVHYWIFSPCQLFWSDFLSDRESVRLYRFWEKQGAKNNLLTNLEELLQDRNILLANLGRVGREMARQIEELSAETYTSYQIGRTIANEPAYEELILDDILVDETEEDVSLLKALQADLLLCRKPQERDKVDIQAQDNSLQVHQAPSKMQEVQILYDTLLRMISEYACTPSDIVVMVPNVTEYQPFIQMVFGHPDSQLNYQLADLPLLSQSEMAQTFLQLINLSQSRWEASSLFELFEHAPFQEKMGWTSDEVQQIREWIQSSGIRWGSDEEHRHEVLQRDHGEIEEIIISKRGSWMQGVDRLIHSLIEENSEDTLPIASIQTELLGQFLDLLKRLRIDLKPFQDHSQRSLKDWYLLIKSLAENYLAAGFQNEKAYEQLQELNQVLLQFLRAAEYVGETLFSFTSIQVHFEGLFSQKERGYNENQLQAVRFSSLVPMQVVPAKIIALIGLEDGVFPRRSSSDTFNILLKKNKCDYFPSQIDHDRYLFLESLLSARQALILSWTCSETNAPSLLITELMNYLDAAFTMDGEKPSKYCCTVHPYYSFDAAYFTQNSPIRSFSMRKYQEACAFYQLSRKPEKSFIVSFKKEKHIPSFPEELYIDLKDLNKCAKHPIKMYLNKTLGIYLEAEDKRILKDQETLDVEHYLSHNLIIDAIKSSPKSALQKAERAGLFPPAPFHKIFYDRMEEEVNETHSLLNKLGMQDVFEITFSKYCEKPEKEIHGSWLLPPIEVVAWGQKVKITGKLPLITTKGMIGVGKDLISMYPSYLLFQACRLEGDQDLILTSRKKTCSALPGEPLEHLGRYIEYYLTANQHVSPLMPKWVKSIYYQDKEAFQNEIDQTFSDFQTGYHDEYLVWALKRGELQELDSLMNDWTETAQSVFAPIVETWMPSKGKPADD